MNKYACFSGDEFRFNVHADDEAAAMREAQAQDRTITKVELTSETSGRGIKCF